MDRNQVRLSLLKITVLVLLGTTWVFWSFVNATRPVIAAGQAAPVNTLDRLLRLPASLPTVVAPTTKTLPPIDMSVMPLRCWDVQDASAHDTGARWVRLTGKACEVSGTAENVSVRNTSNGYTSTVFAASGSLTTDFIPLQPGENEILIRFESAPGVAVESRFAIHRRL